MAAHQALILRAEHEDAAAWEGRLDGVRSTVVAPTSTEGLREALRDADAVLVSVEARDAVERLRRASRAEPAVQPIVVSPPEDRSRVERSILFAPGLGEVWIVAPAEVDAGLVARAAEVSRKRRGYRSTKSRIADDLAALQPQQKRRTVVSDAFLATLLDAAPHPMLSIDHNGTVLSWNPGAERVLGFGWNEAIGRPLDQLIVPAGGERLPDLAEPTGETIRTEMRFRRKNGDIGIGELVLAPVEAAGERVRAVILHDLTTERETQTELEAQAIELEAQAAELQQQAAELEMVNAELQERTEELERASSARSRFYAAMSHELRTPINAILGYQDLLLSGISGELTDKQTDSIERSQRATRHLVELVNDVLDLAKIEAGRIEVEEEEVMFPLLVEELLDTVRSLAEKHGASLAVRGEGEHTIWSDGRRVRQILLNLISNAIKYGGGTPVEVRWSPLQDGGIRVDVVDRGRGIAAEDLERIFEEFTQIDAEGGGTGLGLAISRQLAQILGGTLEASSAVGEGSRFRLTLPARTPQREGPASA